MPSYFNDYQKQLTKDAATIAGIDVLRFISSSATAGLSLVLENKFKEENFLFLFDFGGGTLNLSLTNGEVDVLDNMAIGGDNHFGGVDFDNILIEYCCEVFKKKWGIEIKSSIALRKLRT